MSENREGALRDIPEQLGDFRIIRSLGRGGMARVYLAEQQSLKRMVALKVLDADQTRHDPVLVERFQREAKAGAGLTHPNIVQVYAVGEESGIHYIAQEYVRGANLKDYLVRHGPPPIAVCLKLMRQAAAALQAAADAGIVHRDIKPGNLLITRGRVLKVADFGLARVSHVQPGDLQLTRSGMTMGTPLYMSPEQVNGGQLDVRSDLYSLGVTFFHLLAGRPPFEGPTAMSVAVQHLRESPPQLALLRPDVSCELSAIVLRMMAKEPGERYATARDVLRELKRIPNQLTDAAAGADDLASTLNSSPLSVQGSGGVTGTRESSLGGTLLRLSLLAMTVAGFGFAVGRIFRPGLP